MNQANSVPAFLELRVSWEKVRMKKGTCCALQRKFFRNKIPSLPGNNYGFLELEPQFKKKKKKIYIYIKIN